MFRQDRYKKSVADVDVVLTSILKNDNSIAFTDWLDKVSRDFDVRLVESAVRYGSTRNAGGRLHLALTECIVQSDTDVDVREDLLTAMLSRSAYGCFYVLMKYKRLGLLTFPIFGTDALIDVSRNAVLVNDRGTKNFPLNSFSDNLVNMKEDEAVKWLYRNELVFSAYLRRVPIYKGDGDEYPMLSSLCCSLLHFEKSEFLVSLARASIIQVEVATRFYNEYSSVFHPETIQRIERLMLSRNNVAGAGKRRAIAAL